MVNLSQYAQLAGFLMLFLVHAGATLQRLKRIEKDIEKHDTNTAKIAAIETKLDFIIDNIKNSKT